MSCKAITWVSTLEGSLGIGVFNNEYGKITVRVARVLGDSPNADIDHVESWGGRLPIDELERLLCVAKEEMSGK